MTRHTPQTMRAIHRQSGATLAAVLILVTAGMLLGISALRSATTEAQLGGMMKAAQEAFWLAELGIASGIRFALNRPADLPRDAALHVATPAHPEHGRVNTAIHLVATDAHCPALAPADAIRNHYEIHATGFADHGAASTHVQGFYICSEVCATAGCDVPEYPPVRSYWKAVAGGLPP